MQLRTSPSALHLSMSTPPGIVTGIGFHLNRMQARLVRLDILLCLATVLVAACSTNIFDIGEQVEQKQATASALINDITTPVVSRSPRELSQRRVYQGADFISNRAKLPSKLRTDGAIRFGNADPISLPDALTTLAEVTDLPFALLAGPSGIPVNIDPVFDDGQLTALGLDARIQADFDDSLPKILDQIAANYDLVWRYEGGRIVFRQFITGRYRLAALPSQSAFSSSVGSTSSTGAINLPQEISSALSMLAGAEAEVSFGDGTGILTVIARPEAQRRIAKYVHELNGFLSRQVTFDVNVLSITHRHSDQFSLDFEIFAGSPNKDFFEWSANQPQAAGGNVNVGILSGDVDLNLVLTALDRIGDVAVETRTGATTSNNQIVPIQVVSETAYAKSIKSAAGANGELATTIEPGTITTGFEMQLLPRILPSGDVLLRYSIRLSDLNDMAEFTSDKQTIQLPRFSTTSFEQQAILGDDEVLVLMGFERDRKSVDRPGDSLKAGLLGSRSGAQVERISTVLTIRPRIDAPALISASN